MTADVRNLQGDVTHVLDEFGNVVAEYRYDAWGNVLYASGRLAHTNPITYRGYYKDWATGLFYLQSRYYCPGLRRFISADVYMDTGVGILGTNMYIYCNNDPVMFIDPDGYSPLLAIGFTAWGINSLRNMISDVNWGEVFHSAVPYMAGPEATRSRQQATQILEFEFSANQVDGVLEFLDLMSDPHFAFGAGLGLALASLFKKNPFLTAAGFASIIAPYVAPGIAEDIRSMDYSNGIVIRFDSLTGAFSVSPRRPLT